MNKYKIAFFDIDGTLIDTKSRTMTKRTEETLLRLKEQGVLLCIATGRPLISVPRFENIDFDAYLTFNGSCCMAGGEVIYRQPIAHEAVLKILANAKKINRPLSVASVDRIEANGTDRDLDDYFSLAKQRVKISEDFDSLIEEDIYQIMMGAYPEEYEAILKGVTEARITAWWKRAVDIIPADSGKGKAVHKILEHFHLDPSEAIAFGDGENDIEMLQAAGCGVAMGNASALVKEAADDVCGEVGDDGIYHYCVSHNIIMPLQAE